MAYIEKRFHLYNLLSTFEEHRDNNLIDPDSICFIVESKQIYTQNTLFGLSEIEFNLIKDKIEEHEAILNNILGVSGDSTEDTIINNLSDLTAFFDGYSTEDTLQKVIEALKTSIINQITSIENELKSELNNIKETVEEFGVTIDANTNKVENSILEVNALLDKVYELDDTLNKLSYYTNTGFSEVNNTVYNFNRKLTAVENMIGAVNGIATLDSAGKVPSTQLPSYVDDVLEFDSEDSFPEEGESGKIYISNITGNTYRWSGSQYVQLTDLDSVRMKELLDQLNIKLNELALNLDTKVTEEEGKGLSTNDFTDEYKEKLDSAATIESVTQEEYDTITDIPSDRIYVVKDGTRTKVFLDGEWINKECISVAEKTYNKYVGAELEEGTNKYPLYNVIPPEDSGLDSWAFNVWDGLSENKIYIFHLNIRTNDHDEVGTTSVFYYRKGSQYILLSPETTGVFNSTKVTFKLNIQNNRFILEVTPTAQPDWNETDTNSEAYIKNKPTSLTDFDTEGFVTQEVYDSLVEDFGDLTAKYDSLTDDYNTLSSNYSDLLSRVEALESRDQVKILTQAEYDALASKDNHTLYVVP